MISRLQYITPDITGDKLFSLVDEVCFHGIDWVQLRLKNISTREYVAQAREVRRICNKYGATLIINDNLEVAVQSKADGVHLGKKDLSTTEARKMTPSHFIIGGTANTLNDVEGLIKTKVDYVGLGPFRFTSTKKELSPILGLDGYNDIINKLSGNTPIIAIGGIVPDDVSNLMTTGIHGVAASSVITNANNRKTICSELLDKVSIQKVEL